MSISSCTQILKFTFALNFCAELHLQMCFYKYLQLMQYLSWIKILDNLSQSFQNIHWIQTFITVFIFSVLNFFFVDVEVLNFIYLHTSRWANLGCSRINIFHILQVYITVWTKYIFDIATWTLSFAVTLSHEIFFSQWYFHFLYVYRDFCTYVTWNSHKNEKVCNIVIYR